GPPTSPFVSLPLAAGPAMRDPEPGFAPRWIRTPMRSPRCLLGALVALLLLSFVICGELTPLGVLFRGCWGLGTPPVGLRVPLPQCLGCWWRGTRGGGCKLCPVGWTLHRSKCFLVASKSSSWRESREKCSHQRAQLLVPEDQGELDFLNQVIQKPTRYFWIGLSQPSVGMGWTWLDGSRLDQSRCHGISPDRIISETCGSALAWICQKEAVLL
uniref:C-type lectin domain-containing protein n=1 Tax=Cairina moschata TaxID=8855 RepID=A0A8C3BPS5_CAIMO